MENNLFIAAKKAVKELALLSQEQISDILNAVADALIDNTPYLIEQNSKDLALLDTNDPRYDRLLLDKQRIDNIAIEMRNVASMPSPRGEILEQREMPNGMLLKKISVPFGVLGVIYEARPNVSCDVFALALRSGNVAILKGGSEALHSNTALVATIHSVLHKMGVTQNLVTLLPSTRQMTAALLQAVGYVDIIIPRGGKELIGYVQENAKVPVIETGAGICHTYFDKQGNATIGRNIITNAKTRRVSVCNALDCLIVHNERVSDLPFLCGALAEKNVLIFADAPAYKALKDHYPGELLQQSNMNSYGTEFLSYTMAIKSVANLHEAIDHILKYSSKHSEAIISDNTEDTQLFVNLVDAACVYVNTPTSFTDGAQFGLGAEIGISTQKLHARGPMSLREINTYKWVIEGYGQIRL